MSRTSDFQKRQLNAIQNYYLMMRNKMKKDVTLTDAIISWFTEGYAEKFREEYFRQHTLVS